MNQQAMRLYSGVTNIDDALIEEAQDAATRGTRQKKDGAIWMKWGVAACAILTLALAIPHMSGGDPISGASAGSADTGDGSTGDTAILDGNGVSDGAGGPAMSGDTMPGGIRPVLRVGDTLYDWGGLSDDFNYPDGSPVHEYTRGPGEAWIGGGLNLLPAGYEPIGELSGVTTEEPDEDLELRAGFAASGTVYAHPDYPQVVIVCIASNWMDGVYIRFDAREGQTSDGK